MEILELKITMTEIRILVDGFDGRTGPAEELENEHKLEGNNQNDVERDKIVKIQKKRNMEVM